MTEISRKIIFNDMAGSACGPVDLASIDAEIILQDGPETVYVFGEWVSEADEIRCMSVRKSLFDICAKLTDTDDIDALSVERNEIESEKIADDDKYQDYYTEIKRMISKEMSSHGYKSGVCEFLG